MVGGQELEPLLASGAIALLDAGWLVCRRSPLVRRQELPDDAFITLAELKQAGTPSAGDILLIPFCQNAFFGILGSIASYKSYLACLR